MKLLNSIVVALAFFCVESSYGASPSVATFHVDATKRGELIGNKVSTVNLWQFQTWKPAEKGEGADLTKFVEHIQFMQATGGNASRDLFKDPANLDVLDDYDFSSLVAACRTVLSLNAKPHIKLSVPDKFSRESAGVVFGVDGLPPDDYETYYRYIRALAETLVQEFGLEEVKTWGWGVLVEFENVDWFHDKEKTPEGSREAYFKLYDYSYSALSDVLGPDVYIGAHAMACTEGLWDERDLLNHCATGVNARTKEKGVPIRYFAVSFYDDAPNRPHPMTLAETVRRIRERAESLGLNDLRYGVDEGRILGSRPGKDKTDLIFRIVGQTYQAAHDAHTFKIMVDNNIDYFSAWSYSTDGAYKGYPLITYRVAEQLYEFRNSKVLETTSEKELAEGVECECTAGYDEETDVVHVVAHNFKFDLNYADSADVTLEISVPFWKGKEVEIVKTTIDDQENFFNKWLEDKEKYQITDDMFHWSPDSGALDTQIIDPEKRTFYFNELRSGYVEKANVPPRSSTTTVRVGDDGVIKTSETLERFGVAFYTLRAK